MESVGVRAERRLSRRTLLASSAVAVVGSGMLGCSESERAAPAVAAQEAADHHAFFAAHQPGILTPQQAQLQFVALDIESEHATDLHDLLTRWSAAAADLMAGKLNGTGEAQALGARGLTVTIGLGPAIFERYGLGAVPRGLAPLPSFRGEEFDPRRSGGDLCLQVCADDSQVAFHAVHTLLREAHTIARPRWTQTGFMSRPPGGTGRNLLGFKDGTRNVDARGADRHVWVGENDGPPWMAGGTYLVARRVRTLLDVWDATSVEGQERTIGRHKASGAPLGGRGEHDPPDLTAAGPDGAVIPSDAHVRLAAPESNGGATMLRRGYNFSDGVDGATGQLDAGLFFISFQRDPARQFVPVQQRLSEHDALNKHLVHTASAVFACPPGARRGGFVGEGLFS